MWRFAGHRAAVKALAWSPHQARVIASGGGTHDRTIRFHATTTGEQISCVDVGAQVTQLEWAPHANELASTQGFSQNSLILWRFPSMAKVATLTGHQHRVLYMAVAPDGQSIVTGAADETLRFWNAFPGPAGQRAAGPGGSTTTLPMDSSERYDGWSDGYGYMGDEGAEGGADGGDAAYEGFDAVPPPLGGPNREGAAGTSVLGLFGRPAADVRGRLMPLSQPKMLLSPLRLIR